jgi:hypothetical protein
MRRAVVALCIAAWCVPAGAQEPSLETVLARAAAYVHDYQQRLAAIVSEEHYRQQVASTSRAGRMSRQYRELRSDVLLVKPAQGDSWVQFRDVFEVDRKPVRDRDGRLYKLFVEAHPERTEQVRIIQDESSRYNIGPLTRTINIPIMGLLFFAGERQPVSEYKRSPSRDVKGFASLAAPESIWVVEFKETGQGTIVRGDGGRDLPSHGRAWIESTTGRILRTEQISLDTFVRAEIVVSYRKENAIEVLVPAEMRETYVMIQRGTTINARASYSKFRQFTVTTTEKPKPQ